MYIQFRLVEILDVYERKGENRLVLDLPQPYIFLNYFEQPQEGAFAERLGEFWAREHDFKKRGPIKEGAIGQPVPMQVTYDCGEASQLQVKVAYVNFITELNRKKVTNANNKDNLKLREQFGKIWEEVLGKVLKGEIKITEGHMKLFGPKKAEEPSDQSPKKPSESKIDPPRKKT